MQKKKVAVSFNAYIGQALLAIVPTSDILWLTQLKL